MALEDVVVLESGLEEYFQLRRPLFQGDTSQETCIALVVMKRQGGVLVATPLDFLNAEDKANIRMLGEASTIGPRAVLTVPAERETDAGGREQVEDLEVVVFDLDVSMLGHLTPIRAVTADAQDLMMPFLEGDPSVVPESDGLVRFVKEWVGLQTGDGPGAGNLAFYSAVEEEEEKVPETPAAGKKPKEPKGEKQKRVTTAMLADQLATLMDAIPKITDQLVTLQEDQRSLRLDVQGQAQAPPVRPGQVPISAGVPRLPDTSGVAKLIGAPPKVKGMPSPVGLGIVPKPAAITKGLDSQLDLQGQAEELEEPGSVLASAVLEQSRALTSLVSHLQQGGDPLLGGQADSSGLSLSSKGTAQRERLQLQLANRSGGFFLAVLQNALRKVKPSARLPTTLEEAAACDFSMITYLERYGGYGASKELGLIQYAIAHIFDAAMLGDMAGVQELDGGSGTISDGWRSNGFCLQDDAAGGATESAVEFSTGGIRPSVESVFAVSSAEMGHCCLGVLQRSGLYSVKAPRSCSKESSSTPSGSKFPGEAEEAFPKGGWKADRGGEGLLSRGLKDDEELVFEDGEEVSCRADDLAWTLPPEVLKEEDPCPRDRWCSESGRTPGDRVRVLVPEDEDEKPFQEKAKTVESKLGAEDDPLKPTAFPSWVERFVEQVIGAKTHFSFFVKSTIKSCRSGRLSSTATALFPIPFADVAIWNGPSGLSKEKRIRVAELKVLHLVICGLNYQYFRQPFSVLMLLRRRPSSKHVQVFSRLLSHIRACGHSDMVSMVGCGRKSFQLSARFDELWRFLKTEGLDGGAFYGRGPTGHRVEKDDEAHEELRPYRDLDASRLRIAGEGNWDCSEYLPDLFYMVFKEPRINVFDLPFREDEVPDNSRNSHEEMLALCRVWDARGLLRIIPTELGPARIEMCTRVFNNYKNVTADRQIGDRRGANSQEGRIPGPSKALPSATSLLQLSVRRWEQALIGSITDRKDFYHQFDVSWEKSSLNAIFPWPRLSELKGLRAAEVFGENFGRKAQRKRRDREKEGDHLGGRRTPLLVGGDPYVVPCFGAIFQGDHLGVEIATASHIGLLQEKGLLKASSRLLSTSFVVEDGVVDGLVIDDYFVVSREDVRNVGADGTCESSQSVQKLKAAKEAYQKEKIQGSDDKDILGASLFKVVGGEVNSSPSSVSRGNVPVGAPAQKRWSLAMLSAAVAMLPSTTDALHSSLVGSWVSVLMYRRPLMSTVSELFKVIPAEELDTESPRTWPLSRKAAEELLLLAVMAPVMSSNLAVPFDGEVLATDASMGMGGICTCEVPPDLAVLLWRSSDLKGENVPLMRTAEALLHYYDIDFEETGKEECRADPEEDDPGVHCSRPIGLRFEFIEICGGAGAVTAHLSRLGVVCAPVFDLSSSQQYDIKATRVLRWLVFMLEDGRIIAFLVAPPCTTFSAAAFPALRSYRVPMGFDLTNPRVLHGNCLAMMSLMLIQVAKRVGAFGAIEQPLRSKMRWLPHWRRMILLGAKEVHLASCAFGSPHEKKFCFMSVHMDLEPIRRKCSRDHLHLRVEGKFTKPSATYTKGLAIALARVFRDHVVARQTAMQRLDVDVSGLEDVVSNDLSTAWNWKVQDSWRWKGSSHINLLEASAIGRAFCKKAKDGGDRRFIYLCDSHVARASCARGRTSSDAMRPILKRIASLSVAYGLYGHGRFSPTRMNPADAPTRNYDVPEPVPFSLVEGRSVEEVAWMLKLPRVRRGAANWMRLVLLYLPSLSEFYTSDEPLRTSSCYPLSGPEVMRDFDSSRGYPGEGPQALMSFFVSLWIFSLPFLTQSRTTHLHQGKLHQLLWVIFLCGCVVTVHSTGARGSHGDNLRREARAGIELPHGRRVTELTSTNRPTGFHFSVHWLALQRGAGP